MMRYTNQRDRLLGWASRVNGMKGPLVVQFAVLRVAAFARTRIFRTLASAATENCTSTKGLGCRRGLSKRCAVDRRIRELISEGNSIQHIACVLEISYDAVKHRHRKLVDIAS
jgi:hypothetical protein